MDQFTFDLGETRDEREYAMAVCEQPPQRLETFGTGHVSHTDLLAMVIQGSGTRTAQAVAMASRLMAEAGSIGSLLSWTPADYRRIKGIGRIKALQLAAIAEIARRMIGDGQPLNPVFNRADVIAAHFQPIVSGLQVEKFWVACLNRKNRLLKRVEITSGTATAALAHPREVFRAAIRESATAIVCIHNHPSGDPAPSAADLQVTRQLREAAKAVDIELLDHVILGRPEADPLSRGYYSFREAGLL